MRRFDNFSAKNHESFTRLKWRWINNNLQKKGLQEEQKENIQALPSYTLEEIHNLVNLVKNLQS